LLASDRASLITSILDDIAMTPGVRHTEAFDGVDTLKHTYAWTWIV
jgi:hypothetical protein